MKNLKEFKALIERYETITLDEIQTEWKHQKEICMDDVYNIRYLTIMKLTGFGSSSACTLCQAVKTDIVRCTDCVYEYRFGCLNYDNEKTYEKIENCKTPKGLLIALRNRAKHLRKSYKTILNENN